MAHVTVKFRASEVLLRRLDALAQGHGGNRSQALRALVTAASLPDGALGVPDRDELLRLLGEQARMGSLPAIRALLAEYRREPSAPSDEFSVFNELERRRRTNGRPRSGRPPPPLRA